MREGPDLSTTDSDATAWADEITPHQGMVTAYRTCQPDRCRLLPMSGLFNGECSAAITVADYLGHSREGRCASADECYARSHGVALNSPGQQVNAGLSITPTTNFPPEAFSANCYEFPGYGRYGHGSRRCIHRRQELLEEAAKWADLMITPPRLQYRSRRELRTNGRSHAVRTRLS